LQNRHDGQNDENCQPNQFDTDVLVLLNEKYAADCCGLSEILENILDSSHFSIFKYTNFSAKVL